MQHASADDLGCIAPWLAARGLSPQRTAFYEGDAAPALTSFDSLLILGGSMNVDEEALYPWLTAEKRFIADALAAGKRILGICLGAQLLAEALGARVTRNPQTEIGWFDLTLSEAGRRSSWFADFPDVYPAMHWHGYGYELPAGASLLASSAMCEQQAFDYDDGRVLAVQYHPEVTAANVRRWLSDEHLDAASGVSHPQQMAEDLAAFATANRLTYAMLDRWFSASVK